MKEEGSEAQLTPAQKTGIYTFSVAFATDQQQRHTERSSWSGTARKGGISFGSAGNGAAERQGRKAGRKERDGDKQRNKNG